METMQLSPAASTTGLTFTPNNSVVEKLQNLLDKWQAAYPDSYVSDWFLANINRAERDDKPCATCNGYPCKKGSGKDYKHIVCVENGALNIRYALCNFAIAAKHQARANRQFKLAKIPPMYVGKTFDDYQVDAGNKNAVAWAKKADSLYLFGEPGTGKTFLAAIMAQEFLKRGKSVIFGDVPSLLDQLKGTFDEKTEATLEDLMQTLSDVDVLVLDDLGTETPTDWAVERLYLIVNNRYNANKPIIVTSNYDPDNAAARLNKPKKAVEGVTGSRIISRICQMCKLVKLSGDDRRINRRL